MSVTSNGKKVILGILALTLAAVVACGAAAPEPPAVEQPQSQPQSQPQAAVRWQPLHPSRRLPLLLLRRQQRRPLNWRRRPSQLRWLPPRQSFR
jgi:hypothetical protein